MKNTFFDQSLDVSSIKERVRELEQGRVGFYSIGLYPASLAYNSAMQTDGLGLLLAPRAGRELFGVFSSEILDGMDSDHLSSMVRMGTHNEGSKIVNNSLSDLLLRCELVILSSNSNHIENDLLEACRLRKDLDREEVVLACLAGSFCHDDKTDSSYVLCEKEPNLGFFSGFHRHDALRNPLDSFTANFCHPDALTSMIGARLLDKLSPNIQVSSGVHNVEGQYIKASKNISSIFAGFGHTFHGDNPGVLPTLLTLLLEQCLDQAASVSMCRKDRQQLYNRQPFSLTELGYGVQRIEAALVRDGDMEMVRDHTFAQLTAMVADVRGSMMLPLKGRPTRNFQAGQVLANNMRNHKRCPNSIDEFLEWCEAAGLQKGGLEGIKALKYWPQIIKNYSLPLHDSSMINLLYMCIYGSLKIKKTVFSVMTQSRELTNYCQESVRPTHSRKYAEALSTLDQERSLELIVNAVISVNTSRSETFEDKPSINKKNSAEKADYLTAMTLIEKSLK